jgi:putative acetyltransferase
MVEIRPEIAQDKNSIRRINELAFGRSVEADIIDKLRQRGALTLSLVAVTENGVVGHITFSPVTVESPGSSFEAIALGTMAVLPDYQRQGIGSALVRAGLDECRRLGQEIAVVVGHPNYYPRFGFVPARTKGIDCEFEAPDEAWMALELKEGGLVGRVGTVLYRPEFKEGN